MRALWHIAAHVRTGLHHLSHTTCERLLAAGSLVPSCVQGNGGYANARAHDTSALPAVHLAPFASRWPTIATALRGARSTSKLDTFAASVARGRILARWRERSVHQRLRSAGPQLRPVPIWWERVRSTERDGGPQRDMLIPSRLGQRHVFSVGPRDDLLLGLQWRLGLRHAADIRHAWGWHSCASPVVLVRGDAIAAATTTGAIISRAIACATTVAFTALPEFGARAAAFLFATSQPILHATRHRSIRRGQSGPVLRCGVCRVA